MKKSNKILWVTGLSLILPGLAQAAAPVNFDGWSASSGTIDTSASCAAVTCTTLVSDKGMLQEEIIASDGYKYLRLIVTDTNADGAPADQTFTSENFIPFAFNNEGISQGLATKQVVRDAAQGFTDIAEIQRSMMRFRDPGMFNPSDLSVATPADEMWSVRLTQVFDRADMQASFQYVNYTEMVSSFPAATPDTNNVIGHTISISQMIPIANGAPDVDPDAQQVFEMREAGGVMGNFPVPLFFPSLYFANAPITTAGDMTLNGTTVAWSEGDTVNTSWVVQTDLFDATKISVAAQTVSNLTTGDSAAQLGLNETTPLTPYDWDVANFGAIPSYP